MMPSLLHLLVAQGRKVPRKQAPVPRVRKLIILSYKIDFITVLLYEKQKMKIIARTEAA
jgi:hypothetical protein